MNPATKYYGKFIAIGIAAFAVSIPFFWGTNFVIISFLLLAGPPMLGYYLKNTLVKGMEENFRVFLDDLKDLLQAGVNISDALEITARNEGLPRDRSETDDDFIPPVAIDITRGKAGLAVGGTVIPPVNA